ncbi:hypothetical protein ACEWY4_000515 [Coilia grayii]|uniref:Prostaglandin E synthase 3 n=1 Tax=Coilia grayii TaxID=363190 RepID=A0ABD1KWW9_9TELE
MKRDNLGCNLIGTGGKLIEHLCRTSIGHLSSTDGQRLSFAMPTEMSDAINLSTLVACFESFAPDILSYTSIDGALTWLLNLNRHPATAKWYDRRDCVFIEFCVADSKDVQVKFEKSKCAFGCLSGTDGVKHSNEIDLFEAIDQNESKHKRTDRSVLCCLKKAEAGKKWPRLTKEKAKLNWLSVDFNNWKDWEDDSDEELDNFDRFSEVSILVVGNKHGSTEYDMEWSNISVCRVAEIVAEIK